jgi:putative transposase
MQTENIVRDLKKYTSKQIIKSIQENNSESKKEWMLNLFSNAGKNINNNKEYQFWKQDFHPIALNTAEKIKQRLGYLHENPTRSGLVWEPWRYKYSSAIDYYTYQHGLLKVELCCKY